MEVAGAASSFQGAERLTVSESDGAGGTDHGLLELPTANVAYTGGVQSGGGGGSTLSGAAGESVSDWALSLVAPMDSVGTALDSGVVGSLESGGSGGGSGTGGGVRESVSGGLVISPADMTGTPVPSVQAR